MRCIDSLFNFPLSFFLRIWYIRNEIRLIFLLYYAYNHPVQYVAYKNFSHCWSIQDLELSTFPSKGMREKLIAILLVMIFPLYEYSKYHRETDFGPSYLKIRLTILDSLIIFKKNMYGSDTKIVWTVQAFHGCIDTSTRWSRVCKVYTLSHTFGR